MITRSTLFALTLALGTAPAFAAQSAEPATVTVRINDLNLTSEQGQQRLDTRIKSAARAICHSGERGLAAQARKAQCIGDAIASAQPQAARAIVQAKGGTQLALLMVSTTR